MNVDQRGTKTGVSHQRIITSLAILLAISLSCVVMSCCGPSRAVLSKPPNVQPINSQSLDALYAKEFAQTPEKYYWEPISADNQWEVYVIRENTGLLPGGFFSLRLRNKNSGDSRILFTLWDADVDSGIRANVRWSKDGKALQISGDTRGFSYEPAPDPMKFEQFNFMYLPQDDSIHSLSTDTANNSEK